MSHWNFSGYVCKGELIVHKDVVEDIIYVFRKLFEERYPVEKMVLIDRYRPFLNGVEDLSLLDEVSCSDNNSSAFCSRTIAGENTWSYHAFGKAVDINPLLNPYSKKGLIVPKNGEGFLNRKINCKGVIKREDPCYMAFIEVGWKWGGDWKLEERGVDYQHFYKE